MDINVDTIYQCHFLVYFVGLLSILTTATYIGFDSVASTYNLQNIVAISDSLGYGSLLSGQIAQAISPLIAPSL